jgi:lipopolysaccharide export system protein LptA
LRPGISTYAQKPLRDTVGKIPINIVNTKNFEAHQSDSGTINKFIGDVQFKHGTDLLFCDSAYLNQLKNSIEAFGNVKIVQENGTEVLSDYLRYTGSTRKAFLSGDVSLTNGKDNLWTEELDYDLSTKVGNYYKNGTLQSGSTTVSSVMGMYNARLKESRFIQDVYVTDTQYNIESKDLGYNTDSKIMRFFDSTVVYNSNSTLRTSQGTYDSKNEIAHFTMHSSILNKEHYIEGDTLDYDRPTGLGKAMGNVIIIDTTQHGTLFCGRAFYNDRMRTVLAVDKPVLKRVQNDDSLYIRADTFFSAHLKMKSRTDSTAVVKDKKATGSARAARKKGKQIAPVPDKPVQELSLTANQVLPDTTSPKYYTGYHHVRIFSDSLQGKCDSILITMNDSVMRMMKDPVMWARRSQISGDTIIAYLDSGKIKRVFIPNNALLVSQTGPEKAALFNQVQGKTITGNLQNNALTDALVRPNAETIYFPTDESQAYIGVDEAQSDRMRAFFGDGKITRILMEQQVKQTLTPLEQADLPSMRLSRFKWLEPQRPKSIGELFE